MNKQTVGTCGNCSGAVTVDTIYLSVIPPRPKCESCGAYAREDYGPVIPMEASPKTASTKWFELTGVSSSRFPLQYPFTHAYNNNTKG